ncbi:YbaB/EbfC family nucleoid-associated protein [Streptosporangium sp. NPDC000396]|uniref:YbaB/EbfC family nucleoid-associated protein n=1 Tax=Streptosporangium sp. NPDC000396 TaxID=3366185 RepID=UPI0036B748E9
MAAPGNYENIDVDKILKYTSGHFARVDEVQKTMATVVGRAQDEDGLVTVEYAGNGLRELELHPKAMRLNAGELAEKIKETIRDAAFDLQEQLSQVMAEAFGEEDNPMRFFNNPDAILEQARDAEAAYNKTFENVMNELDRIGSRLGL